MENATDAMMIAFGVFVFIIALSVSIYAFNNARVTADSLLYTQDESNYYEYIKTNKDEDKYRVVGLETIIPTLYKYYLENYTVVFKQANINDVINGYTSSWSNWPVYKTTANRNWQSSYTTLMTNKYGIKNPTNQIFSFDLDEETLRHEPWTGSYDRAKNNLDCFLHGDWYVNPNNNSNYINYANKPLGAGGFIGQYKTQKFIEIITEYDKDGIQQEAETDDWGRTKASSSLVNKSKKRMIIFIKIN